jgi:hypothetical protein
MDDDKAGRRQPIQSIQRLGPSLRQTGVTLNVCLPVAWPQPIPMCGSAPLLLGALLLNVAGSARHLACLLHRGEPSFGTPQPLADDPRCKSVIQELPGAHLDTPRHVR